MDDRLQQVFREIFADDALVVTDDTTADDIPAWDSLAHINLMFAVENEFEIDIPDDQLGSFGTVGELRQFLEARAGAR
ncbi:acyl carrier protein [Pseudofrankia asymbiotica]|uniref:Acyl carrier protein n=1 Tax=Pseudofrankia asymbiotica TaxID=1834516 RepID=A0A1V2I781_9ACTN|nr:acyl carrier protein [Pseudofrankia asymbiotica]ONH27759.1 acyl carrier protein [Pseudofrankia asymbiotica]